MQEKIKEILDQIETVIVGKNEVMERILMAILAGGHVLMEDVPGVGKTTTAMTFARVLGLETRRVQFTSDTMPSDIIGFSVYDKDTGKLVYKPGAVMTNLLLADDGVDAVKQRAAAVEMKTSVYEYVTRLAEATRVHSLVQLGLSPRGALAVCRMAKAYAYVQGRDYAMPEDVAAIFPDVCCHRLMLSTKARMMERSAEQIVDEILKNVEMPVIRRSREGV